MPTGNSFREHDWTRLLVDALIVEREQWRRGRSGQCCWKRLSPRGRAHGAQVVRLDTYAQGPVSGRFTNSTWDISAARSSFRSSYDLLFRRFPYRHPDPFRPARDLGQVAARCPCKSGTPRGCSLWWLPAWLPRPTALAARVVPVRIDSGWTNAFDRSCLGGAAPLNCNPDCNRARHWVSLPLSSPACGTGLRWVTARHGTCRPAQPVHAGRVRAWLRCSRWEGIGRGWLGWLR